MFITKATGGESAAGVSFCLDSTIFSLTSVFSNVNCCQTTQKEFCVPLQQNRVTAERTHTRLCVRACASLWCMFACFSYDSVIFGIIALGPR